MKQVSEAAAVFESRRRSSTRPTASFALGSVLAVAIAVAWGGPNFTAFAQQASAGPQIYHVTAFRAAPGHYEEVLKMLTSAPQGESQNYTVVFRHVDGSEWDFLAVEHMGKSATIEAPTASQIGAPPSRLSEIVAWHGDTFAWGPSLEEFRTALNLPVATATSASAQNVYTISDYAALPGHRGQLQQVLDQIAKESEGRTVRLTHLEGAPWQFLLLSRFDSWRQFGDEQAKGQSGAAPPTVGLQLRQHMNVHHDTIATVAAIVPASAR